MDNEDNIRWAGGQDNGEEITAGGTTKRRLPTGGTKEEEIVACETKEEDIIRR